MRPVTKTSDAPPPARCLPGFEHLQRQWDSHAQRWTVRILPGEYYVTCEDEAITTVLGSCISACVRDPKRGVGGMNHFMLPEESTSGHNAWLDPAVGLATRYGSYAMESLVNDLLKLGADRRHLEVKLFGAGRILGVGTDVGARNISFIRRFVEMEGYAIAAEDWAERTRGKSFIFLLAVMSRCADSAHRTIATSPIASRTIWRASTASKTAAMSNFSTDPAFRCPGDLRDRPCFLQ